MNLLFLLTGKRELGVLPSTQTLSKFLTSDWFWHSSKSEDQERSQRLDHAVCGFFWSHKSKEIAEMVWIGVPKLVQCFLDEAVRVGHPKSLLCRTPDPVLGMLVDTLLGSEIQNANPLR